MKFTSRELKRQARETLNGNYGLPMGAFVVTELIVLCITFPFNLALQHNPNMFQLTVFYLATFIISLLSVLLSCGLAKIHLNMARGTETKFSDLFFTFTHRPDRFILAQLLLTAIIFLLMIPIIAVSVCAILFNSAVWYVLTAVVGIATIVFLCIISFSYSLIYYLLIDKPDSGIIAAYQESRKLMQGNKARLLYISFSFLGLSLLSMLSFGIGFLWVSPYMQQTNVAFYRNVVGEI